MDKNYPKKCGKHGLPLSNFCTKKHESAMSVQELNDLTSSEYDNLHKDGRRYELNFDEGKRCDKGCVFTDTVKIK
jgi:hypothetical protein